MKIPRIKNGTVIDHITAGNAVKVLRILDIPQKQSFTVSVAINVKSKLGKKDIVKVENREIAHTEVDKIALIAPKATINIIRDYKVAEKHKVELPDTLVGIAKCSNPTCISNGGEPVESRFIVLDKEKPRIQCYYCDREPDDIASRII
ncbi:MAG: aspartate carbamoyltransferase regulatory subunit [Candidatus Thermoplasmatota archaeon]|nr:aspartate carbamoyltransferase regulatory subunit [Candidatus Thermoplasmatota archaeon]MBS3801474.1 aspartate carbamoyltransferase regulatory subunit [Candidatus Thermoplasmatota archaeon]